ncbi:BspA family leucine-rich repeat surface protein, partial [Leuconostoc falkenbergense]|uniref:BspA family leucine-rich repeat surface protein n=1 Tax=Leuconostoc falkenbergense TaxID=2766470 RepID=UPI0021AA270A
TMRLPNEGRSDLQELIQRVDANVGDDSAEGKSSESEVDEHEEVEPPIEDSNLPESEEQGNQKSVVKAKAPRAITTNTNGTSTWTFDSANSLLVFGAGTLAERIDNNLTNAGIDPTTVINIQFKSGVVAPTAVTYLFANLTRLSQLIDLSHFDTSSVKSMAYWFQQDSALATPDLSAFNTSNVTNLTYMFSGSGVTSLDLSSWDVTKVTSFSNMFLNATKLTTLNLSTWGVERTATMVDMSYMFKDTVNLTNLNLTDFKTTNVTNMDSMFRGTDVGIGNKLVSLDLSDWDVTKVTRFSEMFRDTSNLATLNLSTWGVGRTATDVYMYQMFSGTSSLTNLNLTNFKTTNVTDMRHMFYKTGLTSLDLSGWDVTKVTDFDNMFDESSLRILNLSGWHTTGSSVFLMFYNTTKLWKITLGEDIKFAENPKFTAAPAIGTTIPGTSYKTTAASWQIVGSGTDYYPQGAMVTTTEMYANRTEPTTYVWANQSVQPTPAINTISSLTFGTLGASDFFNGNSPLATNMATGLVSLKHLDNSTTYNVTVAQTSDWTTDGESATIAKSNLKIKYGANDLSTGACSFWSGTSATATKSIAFNHDDTKNFSIWLNPSTVLDTALLGKQLESELTWTLSETP